MPFLDRPCLADPGYILNDMARSASESVNAEISWISTLAYMRQYTRPEALKESIVKDAACEWRSHNLA